MSDFDTSFGDKFAEMKSAASEAVDKEVGDTPDTGTPAGETPAAPVEGSQLASVPNPTLVSEDLDPEVMGDRKVRIKIDGEYQTVSLKEAAAGYSRTSAYTKRMQDLATQRTEIDNFQAERAQLIQQQQQTQAFLNDPNLVLQYLRQAQPQLFEDPQQPIGHPDEIATIEQANQLIERRVNGVMQQLQQVQRQSEQSIAKATQEIQHRAQTGKYMEALNTTVKQVFEAHPILTHIPNAEDNIRYEVAKLHPKTIEEAQEAFAEVAKGMAEDLDKGYQTHNKTKLLKAQKLKTSGIEPPGGSGPQLQPTTNHKNSDGTVNWKSVKESAAAYADKL